MAPIDGTISTKMNIKHPQMNDVNISKAQPSKAKGLGGVRFPRSKNAALLYIYRLNGICGTKAWLSWLTKIAIQSSTKLSLKKQ